MKISCGIPQFFNLYNHNLTLVTDLKVEKLIGKSKSNPRDRYLKYSKKSPLVCFRVEEIWFELYGLAADAACSLGIISQPSVGLLARKALEEYYEKNYPKFVKEHVKRMYARAHTEAKR